MRSLSVTLLVVATLLGYTTSAQVIQTEEKENPNLGLPCGDNAVCTRYASCTNSTLVEKNLDIAPSKDNPCTHYMLVCCNVNEIVEDPPSSNDVDDGDDNGDGTTYDITPAAPVSTTSSSVKPPPTGCGRRNSEGILKRIVNANDNETEYGEFPWTMMIFKLETVLGVPNMPVYQCSGSLIHNQVVLTAAHCLNKIQRSKLIIRGGEWDTKTTLEPFKHQDRSVAEIVIHPEYYKGNLQNDVALLFLDTPLELKTVIQPVCLPPQDAKFDNETCFAKGWGKDRYDKAGAYQAILRKIDLPIVPNKQCQDALRTTELDREFTLHESFICAGGEKGKDTCKGDGGAPLVCPIPDKPPHYYQTGIVSWGIGCGEKGIPGVYTNVARVRNWIDQHMIQRNYGTSSYTPK